MPRMETADSVQQHTEAKLNFYIRYMERYLRILLLSDHVVKINIYDLYCGAGKYSDGNTGSAIRAVEAVEAAQSLNTKGQVVNLHLNDLDERKVSKLRQLLSGGVRKEQYLNITFSSKEAFVFLEEIVDGLKRQNRKTRNLILIDPYGYKDISKESLEAVMSNGRTELVIFLPIEQMYRFRRKTVGDDVENPYLPLKRFVEQFGIDVASVSSEKQFILAVEGAMRFDHKIYSASFSIRNHTGHYYGVFFLTSNLYGLEKIMEVKWELDEQKGYEFTGHNQPDFILELERKESLYMSLLALITRRCTDNIELYEFVLTSGFRPTHAVVALKRLCAEGKAHTIDATTGKPARKGSFKLNYKSFSSGRPSILFRSGRMDGDT